MVLDKKLKNIVIIALLFVTLGIALGAIGAHALDGVEGIEPKNIESWKTGVLYQLFQGLGLLLLVMFVHFFKIKKAELALKIIAIGTVLFSVSIYILVLNHIWNLHWLKMSMIAITPLGGVLMILGWAIFMIKVIKNTK